MLYSTFCIFSLEWVLVTRHLLLLSERGRSCQASVLWICLFIRKRELVMKFCWYFESRSIFFFVVPRHVNGLLFMNECHLLRSEFFSLSQVWFSTLSLTVLESGFHEKTSVIVRVCIPWDYGCVTLCNLGTVYGFSSLCTSVEVPWWCGLEMNEVVHGTPSPSLFGSTYLSCSVDDS